MANNNFLEFANGEATETVDLEYIHKGVNYTLEGVITFEVLSYTEATYEQPSEFKLGTGHFEGVISDDINYLELNFEI